MKFNSDKFLLLLFWIIMIGLSLYLIEILPRRIVDTLTNILLLFTLLALIHLTLVEIFEINIIDILKKIESKGGK